eukprot:RCo024644
MSTGLPGCVSSPPPYQPPVRPTSAVSAKSLLRNIALEDSEAEAFPTTSEERVAADRLPELLRARGLQCNSKDVYDAVDELQAQGTLQCTGSGAISAEDLDLIYDHLTGAFTTETTIPSEGLRRQSRRGTVYGTSLLQRLKRRFFGRAHPSGLSEVYEVGVKPSNRLIAMVVVISLVVTMGVASTGIGIHWTSSMSRQQEALSQELQLVKGAVEFFSMTQAKLETERGLAASASIIASMVNNLGYLGNQASNKLALLNAVSTAGVVLDSLFLQSNQLTMAHTAGSLATMLDYLWAAGLNNTVVNAVNYMNSYAMDEGWEIVLARLPPNTTQMQYLATLKYPKPAVANPMAGIPMRRALNGTSGYVLGPDYASIQVIAGHSPLPLSNLGLVYKCQLAVLQRDFLKQVAAAVAAWNRDTPGSLELMLLTSVNGVASNVSPLKLASSCDGPCDVSTLSYAVSGAHGTHEGIDYRYTVNVLSAFVPLPNLNAFLLLKIDVPEFESSLLQLMGDSVSRTSSRLGGTRELFLAHRVIINGSKVAQIISQRKFNATCGNVCAGSTAAQLAALSCQNGFLYQKDYRDHNVFAGYACVPDASCGIVLKVDEEEVLQTCENFTVGYADDSNAKSNNGMELLLGQPLNSSLASSAQTYADLRVLTAPLISCPGSYCWPSSGSGPLVWAVQGQTGVVETSGYRGKVLAATAYSTGLSLGFALEISLSVVQKPLFQVLLILVGTALGTVLLGVVVLGLSARSMLRSMTDTWQRGKMAVQQQKEQFQALVSALFPPFAGERLLLGERQIVQPIREATIFFSDIHSFTATSNLITAHELIEWIGYVFRVMDVVADYFKIYKIKTIGDAYFAIAGLPGLAPPEDPVGHVMRMMHFASVCAQLFSGRYTHPSAGETLARIAA